MSNQVETEQAVMAEINAAYGYIAGLLSGPLSKPQVGVVCGSALAGLGDLLEEAFTIPYSHIPGFPRSHVAGHQNIVKIGRLNGVVTIMFLGRFHGYEGLSHRTSGLIIRILAKIGVPNLIITNSVGSCNTDVCTIGDFIVIEDHVSLPCLSGANPLMGPNLSEFGGRFVNTAECYHPGSFEMVKEAVVKAGLTGETVTKGIYGQVSGPTYETPSETKFFKSIGCSAVGSGTVPEVLVAAHCKQIQRVVVVGLITNQPAIRGSMATGRCDAEGVVRSRSEDFKRVVTELAAIIVKKDKA